MDRFALDIETIPLVTDPAFDSPEDWTVFAVAAGHQENADTAPDVEVDVLFRDGPTLRDERALLEETVDWIADRHDHDSLEILTYNGTSYDIPILRERAEVVDDEVTGSSVSHRLSFLLDVSEHTDLILAVKSRNGHWTSLDDALNQHDIQADAPDWLGKKIGGSDMPSMGLELLSGRPNDDLRTAVRRYAASDVQPLFELDDCLSRDQVSP